MELESAIDALSVVIMYLGGQQYYEDATRLNGAMIKLRESHGLKTNKPSEQDQKTIAKIERHAQRILDSEYETHLTEGSFMTMDSSLELAYRSTFLPVKSIRHDLM